MQVTKMSKEAKKPKKYTDEYRAEVVRLCGEAGRNPYSVSRELGLTCSMVSTWVRKAKLRVAGGLTEDERKELMDLRREVRSLRQEREILRKATVLFARGATP
jgi:transposase